MKRRLQSMLVFAIAVFATWTPVSAQVTNFGPYVPTPDVIVAELLKLAELKDGDFLVDLGSGDGRIVMTAAKRYGARGFGIEIQDELVDRANARAKEEGLAGRVQFYRQDLFEADVRRADVVTLYLLPSTVIKLLPKFLEQLRPGTRVISHDYPLSPWQPDRVEEFQFEEKVAISGTPRTVLYRYIIPADIGGRWEAEAAGNLGRRVRLLFSRNPTLMPSGSAEVDGKRVRLEDLKLRGRDLSFVLPPADGKRKIAFKGRVEEGKLAGVLDLPGSPKFTARRIEDAQPTAPN